MSGLVSSLVRSASFAAAASVRLRTVGCESIIRCVPPREVMCARLVPAALRPPGTPIVRTATDSGKFRAETARASGPRVGRATERLPTCGDVSDDLRVDLARELVHGAGQVGVESQLVLLLEVIVIGLCLLEGRL